MSDLPTIARDNAVHCEGKKHAYRQTQDGVVVSFVLHPQDIPDGLATAPLGTRYTIALVEMDDNEEPALKGIAQRAAVFCNDRAFQRFLNLQDRDIEVLNANQASAYLCILCGIASRRELEKNSKASVAFEALVRRYEISLRENRW